MPPGGDQSPWIERGVFDAMRVAARLHLGKKLGDVTVAVQGLGHVGYALCTFIPPDSGFEPFLRSIDPVVQTFRQVGRDRFEAFYRPRLMLFVIANGRRCDID